MKILPILLSLSMLLTSCSKTPEQLETDKWLAKRNKEVSDHVALERVKNNMIYFKDERTGLCFAYYWGGDFDGGPALTLVPEDKVKDFLTK